MVLDPSTSFLRPSFCPSGGRKGRPCRLLIPAKVYLRRRTAVQSLMTPLDVVKPKIAAQPVRRFDPVVIIPDVKVSVFDAPPQSLHEHVVHRSPATSEADSNTSNELPLPAYTAGSPTSLLPTGWQEGLHDRLRSILRQLADGNLMAFFHHVRDRRVHRLADSQQLGSFLIFPVCYFCIFHFLICILQ